MDLLFLPAPFLQQPRHRPVSYTHLDVYKRQVLGYEDDTVNQFFFEAMRLLSKDGGMNDFLPTVLKVGEVNLK